MSRAGLFRASKGIAVDMNNRVFRLPSFYDVLEGEIFLQNLPSIVTAHALDPQKGERILDMCAAPGGKTTAIAILMKDEGELVALDRSHNKVQDIQKLAAEMSLTCITTYKLDVLKAIRQRNEADDINTNQSSNSLRFHEEKASSSTAEGFNLDKTCEDNGRLSEECGMDQEGISALVAELKIQKAFTLIVLIEFSSMLPALLLV